MDSFSEKVDGLTIHGVRHLFQKNITSRIFWILTFCASICGLAYYSTNLFIKLSISPDINVRVNEQFISTIPFPAITICSPVFAKNNLAHYSELFNELKKGDNSGLNLSVQEQNYFSSNIQACDTHNVDSILKYMANRSDNNVVKLLHDSFLSIPEVLVHCNYKAFLHNCSKMFLRVLTDRGYCYTFNSQGFNTIFNEKAISEDFHCFKRLEISKSMFRNNTLSNETVNDEKIDNSLLWSPDKGYSENHEADSVPVKAEKRILFSPVMYLKEIDASNICSPMGNIFSYYIHLPNEIAITNRHLEEHVEFRRKKDLLLTATSYRADEGMRKFSPKSRGCYFEGEKPLKFFKSYTKAHCEFECMTNYTLKVCGCVKFSMPRTSKTPVCSIDKASCYYETTNKWPDFEKNNDRFEATCGCLKACSDIKYGIKLEKTSALDNVSSIFYTHNISKGDAVSRMYFVFDDFEIREYEEYAVYKLQNFIADVGGLLGFFLGCSVISLIEIIYFTAKICTDKFKGSRISTIGSNIECNNKKLQAANTKKNLTLNDKEYLRTLHEISGETYINPAKLYSTPHENGLIIYME